MWLRAGRWRAVTVFLGGCVSVLGLAVAVLILRLRRLSRDVLDARREANETRRTLAAYRALSDQAIDDFLTQHGGSQ